MIFPHQLLGHRGVGRSATRSAAFFIWTKHEWRPGVDFAIECEARPGGGGGARVTAGTFYQVSQLSLLLSPATPGLRLAVAAI